MTVGKRIREIRRKMDVSQAYIGRLAGITGAYLSKIEDDKSDPDTELLKKIARALGVEPWVLLDDDEKKSAVIRFSMPGHISEAERKKIEYLLAHLGDLPANEKELIYDLIDTVFKRTKARG